MKVLVLPHALRHGLGEEEIIYAWNSLIRCRQRQSKDEPPRWIAIGTLPDGRTVEMVAFESLAGEWCVFHALTPPTVKFIKELGLKGGKHGRS
jgi:hypothetical protein